MNYSATRADLRVDDLTVGPGSHRLDSQAFCDLALVEIDGVYRMALRLSRQSDEAVDLVQET